MADRGKKRTVEVGFAAVFLAGAVVLSACGSRQSEKMELRMSGIEKLDAEDYSGAAADFEAAIQASGGKVGDFEIDVLKYRAEAEYKLEDYEAAAHTYKILTQVDGADTAYLYGEALMRALGEDADGALSAYKEGVELEKKASESKRRRKQKDEKAPEEAAGFGRTDVLAAVGEACRKAGQTRQAEQLYEEAIQDGAAGPAVWNELGCSLIETQQYEEALEFFEKALQSDGKEGSPVLQEASFNRAAAFEYLGQYEKALEAFEEYVSRFGPDEAAQKEINFLKTRL